MGLEKQESVGLVKFFVGAMGFIKGSVGRGRIWSNFYGIKRDWSRFMEDPGGLVKLSKGACRIGQVSLHGQVGLGKLFVEVSVIGQTFCGSRQDWLKLM